MQQEVVRIGIERNPANWTKLHDIYCRWISERGSEWVAAGFSQAMAESDRVKTLTFLAGELDPRDDRRPQTLGALAGLGAIADESSVPALESFRNKAAGGLFEENAYYRKFLDYALHRCRGIHRWRLVKNSDSTYTIEK
jgi:hypothetical protein